MKLFSAYDTEIRYGMNDNGVITSLNKRVLDDTLSVCRNALAYILRNALDNGCPVNDYRWSAYRAMFCDECAMGTGNRQVASLTKVERRKWMHTGDSLKDVAWRLDAGNSLIPASFCDRE